MRTCIYCNTELTDKRQTVCTGCRPHHRSVLYFNRSGRVRPAPQCCDCGNTVGPSVRALRCVDCRRSEVARAQRERKRAQRPAGLATRVCEHCGTEMPITRRSDARFCSRPCIEKARHQSGVRQQYHRAYQPTKSRNTREWRRLNPVLASNQRTRRRSAEQTGRISPQDWARALNRARGCCYYCGQHQPLTMEHVIPLSRGGIHSIGNVVPACGRCNYSKGGKLLIEWRVFRSRATAA